MSEGAGLFYFIGHSLYRALVFHNFLALFGVTTALVEAGQIRTYQKPLVAIFATALVLVGMEQVGVRRAAPPGSEIADTQ